MPTEKKTRTFPNPKHMSASDMIEECTTADLVELVDKLVGNFLDRDKLRQRIIDLKHKIADGHDPCEETE